MAARSIDLERLVISVGRDDSQQASKDEVLQVSELRAKQSPEVLQFRQGVEQSIENMRVFGGIRSFN